jgi:hypothetical protein
MLAANRLRGLCRHLRCGTAGAAAAAAAAAAVAAAAAGVAAATAGGTAASLEALGFEYRLEYPMVSPDGVHRIHHAETGTRITTSNLQAFTGGDYNDLGQAATRYAHERMLLPELGMRWAPLPGAGAAGNAVLASPDLETNDETLLVLMPGSGSVRAGTWGRTLLITDSLENGSMIGWLRAAFERNW